MVMLVYQRVDVGCILIALGPIFFHILQDVLRDLHPEEPPEQLPEVLQCDAAVAQMWHLGMFWAKKPWVHRGKWWWITSKNGDFTSKTWWFKKQTWWFNKQKSDFTSKSDASTSKKMNFADQNGGRVHGDLMGITRCKPAIFGGDIMGM